MGTRPQLVSANRHRTKASSRCCCRTFANAIVRKSMCWPRKIFRFGSSKHDPKSIDYFKTARANLNASGIMVLDMMGGGECYEEDLVDKRTIVKGKKGVQVRMETGQL